MLIYHFDNHCDKSGLKPCTWSKVGLKTWPEIATWVWRKFVGSKIQTLFSQTNRSNPPDHHQQSQYSVGMTSLVKEKSTNQKARPRLVHLLQPNKIIIYWFLRLAYLLRCGNHKKECLAANVNIPTTVNRTSIQHCTHSIQERGEHKER